MRSNDLSQLANNEMAGVNGTERKWKEAQGVSEFIS